MFFDHIAGRGTPPGQLFADDDLASVPAGSVVPVLDVGRIRRGEDVEVPITTDPGIATAVVMPTLQRTTIRSRPTWHVPFTGSPELFWVRPTGAPDPTLSPPTAEVDGDELVLTSRSVSDDPDEQRRDLDRQLAMIQRCLDYLLDARGQ